MFISNKRLHRSLSVALMLCSSAVFSDELLQREQAAQELTQQFIKQLGGHLKKEMSSNGPLAAVKVCKDIAPAIAAELSLENGWKVTRVSTKVRNSLLGTPDLWERKTLVEFEARAEKGEQYSAMQQAVVVDEDGSFYFRYMKPLAIKPICLKCHGSEEQMGDSLKAELDKQYPFDRAKNYSVGELRGAISIKQPMDIPLRKKF